ncbi:hypothetical protein LRS10_05950 [Phenylobacterium sp. J426]|uniref:hypothetical protein n=1 Tax=Phenylobacterium sp. J426 TaxID=2898439 RepID=UPI002150F633|nr:hypothetical protein [Phenylobacterium sp. J426]MCR5873759.1 hypothetical protein [Phenylobacterium sp. J426]
MKTTTGALVGIAAALGAWAANAQPALQVPATPVAEQVDPTEAIPLVAPAPQLSGPAYDSRLKASLVSAQSFQGPLDGGWRLAGAGGSLYDLQLVDRNNGVVEGAWRDLSRAGAPAGSGFLDAVERDGAGVRLTFDGGKTATLSYGPNGWRGEMNGQPVTLTRRAP